MLSYTNQGQPRKIALYATDTMADWEYAYLTTQIARAEAIRHGDIDLVVAGDGTQTATSLGGLPVQPHVDLSDLADDPALSVLVIPGADTYAAGHDRLTDLSAALLDRGVPVAAICGGTLLLARAGLLDERRHTSNDAQFLQMSGYAGGANYVQAPVVSDRGITTAGGTCPVSFTAEVMRASGLWPAEVRQAWEQLYLSGETRFFHELTEATDDWANA